MLKLIWNSLKMFVGLYLSTILVVILLGPAVTIVTAITGHPPDVISNAEYHYHYFTLSVFACWIFALLIIGDSEFRNLRYVFYSMLTGFPLTLIIVYQDVVNQFMSESIVLAVVQNIIVLGFTHGLPLPIVWKLDDFFDDSDDFSPSEDDVTDDSEASSLGVDEEGMREFEEWMEENSRLEEYQSG